MTLTAYKKKRDFSKTAEPESGKSDDKKVLRFVIQKHAASRLHYDFRLELDGVLKSWAIPKGPSTDPAVKRLAMMVEDHPFSYRTFEGIIPQGEYGGGTVIVWDEGTYEPIEEIKGKKAQEKHLLKQLREGSLKIVLKGKKVQGEFALVKTSGMDENSWLLIKHKDKFAAKSDIAKKDASVLSGRTLDEVAKSPENVWKSNRSEKSAEVKEPEIAEKASESLEEIDAGALLKRAPKSKLPDKVKPMKATLVDEPFDDPNWFFEVKWDGYRALATLEKGEVELVSRNNNSFNEKFYALHKILQSWKMNAVLDGEIVVINEKGLSDFGALQNWRSEADGPLIFYVFDILWYEGKNLMDLSLRERLAILQSVLPADNDCVRQNKVFEANGTGFFDAAGRMGLEGIIAKKADSTYTSDLRSRDWLKIKVSRRQEAVIAGFTKNEGTNKPFSALVLGVYRDGALQYVGKVGTGFNDKGSKELMEQFKPLIVDESPFDIVPDVDKPSRFRPKRMGAKPTWLKPELVCEVAFAEMTSDGVFRQASFQGMRIDKKATEVVLEVPADTEQVVESEPEPAAKSIHKKALQPAKDTGRKTLLNPKDETQVRKICGHELKFTSLSKVYWPEDGVTKRDLFNYYYRIADYILPYLKDRPMSLNRFPGGIYAKSFYQKDIKGKAPEWLTKTFPYTTSDGEHKEYLVGSDESYLLWMATLGCIEMNPWFSRIQKPDYPDYCVIDLDPDQHTFDQVIQAALEVKQVLDALDVPCFPKTSGSTGMHIYIPLDAKYDYDQSQLFAKMVVTLVNRQIPDFTSLERMVAKRKGKMYLDFLQNRPGATIAGPYSLRPKPGATVSMPLSWDEVKPGLTMRDFTIFNAFDRLKETGDLFTGVLGEGIDLENVVAKAKGMRA